MAVGVLVVMGACGGERPLRERGGDATPPVTKEATREATTTATAPTSSPEDREMAERASGERGGDATPPPTREATREATTTATAPTSSPEERKMAVNRIAYVGVDGNIYTINPDGTDSRRLTTTDLRVGPAGHVLAQTVQTQFVYAWPTWSPDSTKLAASLVTIEGGSASFSLNVVDADTGQVSIVYVNEPNAGPMARGAPHYAYWSPDSRHLAFFAVSQRELVMFLSTPADGRDPEKVIGQGPPIYFAWAADSASLVLHRGPELFRASLKGGSLELPRPLVTVGLGFRPPAASPDGARVAYAGQDEGTHALFMTDAEGSLDEGRAIMDLGPSAAFLWSPTADEIAVAERFSTAGQLYDRLSLVSIDGSSRKVLVDETFLAFSWSPTGDKIAYVAFSQADQTLTWKYIVLPEGEPIELIDFLPSPEFFTYLTFFDQYAYSNSIWSPDGTRIVFSGTTSSALRRNGSSSEGEKVYVLEIREDAIPREIASSRFAVWSWR